MEIKIKTITSKKLKRSVEMRGTAEPVDTELIVILWEFINMTTFGFQIIIKKIIAALSSFSVEHIFGHLSTIR